jgi:hypothetical protein
MILRRLDSNGDMSCGNGAGDWVQDSDAVAQLVTTRLRMITGEWFLDGAEGVPWLGQPPGQNILGDRMPQASVEATIKARILATDGVSQLIAFSLTVDRSTRAATVSATILTDYNTTSTVEVTT